MGKFNLRTFIVGALALGFTSLAAAQDRSGVFLELGQVAFSSLKTKTPHYSETVPGIFEGSYDWHSSVHAHWTALSVFRVLGQPTQELLERFTVKAIGDERQRLNKYPSFELPYGQAWLLLLLRELQNHELPTAVQEQLLLLKNETLARITRYLVGVEFPDGYNASCSGTYRSWIMAYMLTDRSEWLDEDTHRKLHQKATSANCPMKSSYDDFQSPGSILSIVTGVTAPKPTPFSVLLTFPHPIRRPYGHEVGRIVTEYWPLALQARTDPEAHNKFYQFVDQFVAQKELWATNFEGVGHWIPQFLWFGIWLELGQP